MTPVERTRQPISVQYLRAARAEESPGQTALRVPLFVGFSVHGPGRRWAGCGRGRGGGVRAVR